MRRWARPAWPERRRQPAWPGTALLATAAIVCPLATPVPAGAAAAQAEQPLENAARAAQQVTFEGVVLVRWTDGTTPRVERLEVRGANGSVVVEGDTAVMASAKERLVAHQAGQWALLWPAPSDGATRPPTDRKYQLVPVAPAVVSARPARVVELRHAGSVVERLYLDQETGLLLRREHFEGSGPPDRTVEFESVTIGGAGREVPAPAQVVNNAPRVVSQPVPSGVSAPSTLPAGYERVGLYRKSGVVQAQYSDGLYDLSVFEQDGRLDRSDLPEGDRLRIGRATGWHYEWPGGHVVVWQQSGTVYTAVSDAPLDHMLTAVRSLPPVAGATSFLARLRQVCRSLVQPMAD